MCRIWKFSAALKQSGVHSDKKGVMGSRRPRFAVLFVVLAGLVLAPPAAAAARNAGIAALQVALRARGYYPGTIDGVKGQATTRAIKRFQRRAGLPADGVVGPTIRRALGTYGKHLLGTRALKKGTAGWDVAALQFLLAWHGFPSATFDGGLGEHTDQALRRYQRWAGLPADGVARASTFAALRQPPATCPLRLAWPIEAPHGVPLGDPFGPRGNRFHAGIDLLAPRGAAVRAAAPGRVVLAGYAAGGWGNLVVLANADGVRTMYAHLSKVTMRRGQNISAGTRVGLVGATGDATGPHLHFEVRLRGAAVDPLTALP
jgi:murein DD-endopeptidase MepM/ murein hydrolase activator NlpD